THAHSLRKSRRADSVVCSREESVGGFCVSSRNCATPRPRRRPPSRSSSDFHQRMSVDRKTFLRQLGVGTAGLLAGASARAAESVGTLPEYRENDAENFW